MTQKIRAFDVFELPDDETSSHALVFARSFSGATVIPESVSDEIRRVLGVGDAVHPGWPRDEWIIGDGPPPGGKRDAPLA